MAASQQLWSPAQVTLSYGFSFKDFMMSDPNVKSGVVSKIMLSREIAKWPKFLLSHPIQFKEAGYAIC